MRKSPTKVTHGAPRKQRHGYLLNFAAFGLLLLMISSAVLAQGLEVANDEPPDSSQDSVAKAGPMFTVYSMRGACTIVGINITKVTFDASELPFELSSLMFGGTQKGTLSGTTYYAGSGMILNATGPHGNITMREQGGRIIRTVEYQGQPSVIINGETAFTAAPKAYSEYEGTEILIQDWLKGTWSPEKGVILERPTGMTIETSEFFVMVFQPQAPVPEFGIFPVVVIMMVAICFAVSRRRASDRP